MISHILDIFTESHQSFEGQEHGEKVLLIIRKHVFTILAPLFFLTLFALIPIAGWITLNHFIIAKSLVKEFFFFISLWYLCLWIVSFYLLTIYILNTVVITDERIIDNHQLGFFDRKVSELHIHRVQDVSVHVLGIIETVLHFGDLVVQTAAEEREFIFQDLPKPDEIKDIIMSHVTEKGRSVQDDM